MITLDQFSSLFEYPEADYADNARRLAARADSAPLRAFAAAISPFRTSELQELFIRTFDLNPSCTLEIGWHLFGEQYERGEFLVDVRGLLRRAHVTEVGELPDHMLHVLPLVARLAPADAAEFSRRYLAPALEKMRKGLPEDNPFSLALAAVSEAAATVREPAIAGGRS
jgi:nitrate reductase delta subunit